MSKVSVSHPPLQQHQQQPGLGSGGGRLGSGQGSGGGRKRTIHKDLEGFEDIDAFWNIADDLIEDETQTDDEDFNYDTGSSISESASSDEETPIVEISSRRNKSPEVVEASSGSDSNTSFNYDTKSSITEYDASDLSLRRLSTSIVSTPKINEPIVSSLEAVDKVDSVRKSSLKKDSNSSVHNIMKSSPFPFETGRISNIGISNNATPPVPSSNGKHVSPSFFENDSPPPPSAGYDDYIPYDDDDEPRVKFDHSVKKLSQLEKSNSAKKLTKTKKRRFSSPGNISMVSTPGSGEYPRGTALSDSSYLPESDEDVNTTKDTLGTSESEASDDETYIEAIRQGAFNNDGQGLTDDSSEDEGRIRRSTRVTKGRRLQYWKNERPIYQQGNMIGLLHAQKTPRKARKDIKRDVIRDHNRNGASIKSKSRVEEKEDIEVRPPKLPKNIHYIDRANAKNIEMWDERIQSSAAMENVCCVEAMHVPNELPLSENNGENVPCQAVQHFNIENYKELGICNVINGHIIIPPRGVKDAETVGSCCQIFVIADCQDGSVELGLAHPKEMEWDPKTAQRLLMKKGDSFFVPPANIYRFENHSDTRECLIYYTVVIPINEEDEDTA